MSRKTWKSLVIKAHKKAWLIQNGYLPLRRVNDPYEWLPIGPLPKYKTG